MTFYNYTVRDRTGALQRGSLQAADRASALAKLQREGLTPVSLEQGKPLAARDMTSRHIALALLALVAAGGAVLWWSRKGAPPRPGVTTTADTAPRHSSAGKLDAPAAMAERAPVDAGEPDAGERVAADSSKPPMAVEQPKPRIWGAQKRLEEARKKGRRTEPLFRHETEQMLALYANPGEMVPPVPLSRHIEEDFLASLDRDIEISEDDTPEDAAKKEMVAWMKADLRKFVEDGGTVQEFFEVLQKRQDEESALTMEARHILYLLAKDGDNEATLKARDELNALLQEKGIAPLPLPRVRARR